MAASRSVDHLLIGGGVASASAAMTLREEGADGSILLVGRELEPPYHRPPLTKELLRGIQTPVETLVRPEEFWRENDVELLLRTSVLDIDLDARVAKLSNKEEVQFETALIATGAMVRRLGAIDGSGFEGIHYLRVIGTSEALIEDAEGATNAVTVGGSYIGCEVASSLTELGLRCTIVMMEDVPLQRAFGHRAGSFFEGVLRAHGIEIVAGDELERFEADEPGDTARVKRVVTKAGRVLPADLVVAGVGALPDVMLARKIGLELGESGGVRCDAQLQTSAPGVFAAGDIAEYDSVVHGRRLRVEHEDVAIAQGRTAALNMLGRDEPHLEVPYFFSDLSDWVSLEYVGPAEQWDEELTRGSLERGEFSHWYLREGAVVAALSVGRSQDLDDARRLIASHAQVDAAVLADPGTDLATLA